MTTHSACVTPADLQEWLATPGHPRLIDVRTPAEFQSAHIAGAYNVPLDLLDEHREDLLPHLDEHTVLICRSGQRARKGETLLLQSGLDNLHVLDGGMQAWEQSNLPVRKGSQKWALDRQVRFTAGSLVLAGLAASLLNRRFALLSAGIASGLVYSGISDSCALGMLLSKLPYNRDNTRSLEAIISDLRQETLRLNNHQRSLA